MPSPDDPVAPLAQFDRYALLSTGRSVHIAPAKPGDEEPLRTFYAQLGDTSTYYRFFGMRRKIPFKEFEALARPLAPHHATMLAWVGDDIVGVGEYHVCRTDLDEAEVAFAVSDDHHEEGIATLLLEDLAVIAAHNGLKRLTAVTLPGNTPMQVVFRTAGLAEQATFEEGVVDVVMNLTEHAALAESAAERERTAVSRSMFPFLAPRLVAVVSADAGAASAAESLFVALQSSSVEVELVAAEATVGAVVRGVPADLSRRIPDLAVVVSSSMEASIQRLREISNAGVPAAIVLDGPSAFDGSAMSDAAHRLGIRILGPCAGLSIPALGVSTSPLLPDLPPGRLAIAASTSRLWEALGTLPVAERPGVSALVTLASGGDVGVEDLLLAWSVDETTDVIVLDLGAMPLCRRLIPVLRLVGRTKPVIVLGAGRSEVDRGALTVVCVVCADSVTDLLRAAGALLTGALLTGARPGTPYDTASDDDAFEAFEPLR